MKVKVDNTHLISERRLSLSKPVSGLRADPLGFDKLNRR